MYFRANFFVFLPHNICICVSLYLYLRPLRLVNAPHYFWILRSKLFLTKFSDHIILKKKHVTDDLILAWSSFQQVKVLLLFVQKKPKENLLWIFLVCVQTRYKVCLLWVHWTYSEIPPSCKTACRFLCSCLLPHCAKTLKKWHLGAVLIANKS